MQDTGLPKMASHHKTRTTIRKDMRTMPGFNSNDDEDDLFDQVVAMADRMNIDDPARRAKYVDDHMIQAGYTRVQTRESYAKMREEEEEAEEESGSASWFGKRATARRTSRPTGNQGDNDRF
jgi:rare lipoprotein A (peptidoglycan hydrolase)